MGWDGRDSFHFYSYLTMMNGGYNGTNIRNELVDDLWCGLIMVLIIVMNLSMTYGVVVCV